LIRSGNEVDPGSALIRPKPMDQGSMKTEQQIFAHQPGKNGPT